MWSVDLSALGEWIYGKWTFSNIFWLDFGLVLRAARVMSLGDSLRSQHVGQQGVLLTEQCVGSC
jgi:hypothetical protein